MDIGNSKKNQDEEEKEDIEEDNQEEDNQEMSIDIEQAKQVSLLNVLIS